MYVSLAGAPAQRRAILRRVEQPVDMVDAQPLHLPAFDHAEDQPVRRLEQLRQFDAQPGEVVDVEKPAIVDLLGRDAPEREPVGLFLEQKMQPAEAVRIAGLPGDRPHRGLQRRCRLRIGCRLGQLMLQFGGLLVRRAAASVAAALRKRRPIRLSAAPPWRRISGYDSGEIGKRCS